MLNDAKGYSSEKNYRHLTAAIFGCSGLKLTSIEEEFFSSTNPFGFILFSRNCESPMQLSSLIRELRRAVGRDDVPILIDQEGGSVIRMGAPNWRLPPAAAFFGKMAEKDLAAARGASWINARLTAFELEQVGINVCCAPVLDTIVDEDCVISTRAFSNKPEIVAELGRATCEGFLAGGIMPMVKHLPGYGRAKIDSHLAVPIVDASIGDLISNDFQPFSILSDMPIGMSAHVIYRSVDPKLPGTTSKIVVREIIRKIIKFEGILLTDDLSMEALTGSIAERASRSINAGCDVVLHCNGNLEEMSEIGKTVGYLSAEKIIFWKNSKDLLRRDKLNNYNILKDEFNNLINLFT